MKKKSLFGKAEIDEIEEEYAQAEMAEEKKGQLIAKKEFEIMHNGYHRKIKVGEDISDVPAMYYENLKTEQVI